MERKRTRATGVVRLNGELVAEGTDDQRGGGEVEGVPRQLHRELLLLRDGLRMGGTDAMGVRCENGAARE